MLRISDAEDMNNDSMLALEYLIKERGMYCIYVTINRPYNKILKDMDSRDIAPDHVIFIILCRKLS